MLQDSKAKSIQSTDKWLKNTDKLKAYYLKQQKEQRLLQIVCEATGIKAEGLFISSSDSNELILQTNNAVLATQIRLASKQILNQIAQSALWSNSFDKLKINVRPLYQKQRSRQDTMRQISPENAQLLEDIAGYTENPKLKDVLLRLAKHRSSGK